MIRLAPLLIGLTAFGFSNQLKSQSVVHTLSNIYFDANIKNFDSSLITFFKANKGLTYFYINSLLNSPGGESYGKDEFFHKFIFKYPFLLNGDSLSGYITVETKKMNGSEKVIFLTLTCNKLNEKRATSLFDYLFKMFSDYYSKSESELRLGRRTDAKYFNFSLLNLGGDLIIKTISNEPEYNVILTLSSK